MRNLEETGENGFFKARFHPFFLHHQIFFPISQKIFFQTIAIISIIW